MANYTWSTRKQRQQLSDWVRGCYQAFQSAYSAVIINNASISSLSETEGRKVTNPYNWVCMESRIPSVCFSMLAHLGLSSTDNVTQDRCRQADCPFYEMCHQLLPRYVKIMSIIATMVNEPKLSSIYEHQESISTRCNAICTRREACSNSADIESKIKLCFEELNDVCNRAIAIVDAIR